MSVKKILFTAIPYSGIPFCIFGIAMLNVWSMSNLNQIQAAQIIGQQHESVIEFGYNCINVQNRAACLK